MNGANEVRKMAVGVLTILSMVVPMASAQAESTQQATAADTRYEAAKGFYGQGGFAMLKTNGNTAGRDPNLGFGAAFGYRFTPWLGSDVQFVWGGRDQGAGTKTRQSSITLNGKLYPVGLFAPDLLDSFQPYVVLGMGGAHVKFDPGAKQASFAFRVGAGADWMITDRIGTFMDLSLHATPGLEGFQGSSKGGATGVVQVGAKFRF